MKHLNRRQFGLAAAGAGLALALTPKRAFSADPPIKVGSFLSYTGPASFLGDPEKKTIDMEIAKINKAGGINGRKIELIMYDDAGNPERSTSFAKRLIENDKVDVIVGGSTTAIVMTVLPLMEQAGMPFFNLSGSVLPIEPVRKWIFKNAHTDRMSNEKVFADMKKRGITKYAQISENVGIGKSGHDEALKVQGNYGLELVADEFYNPRDPDMTAQLTRIKNTPGVQAVLNQGFGQSPAIVTKNYRQLGINVPLYHVHGVATVEFIRLAGEAANGVRMSAAGIIVADQLPDSDPQKKTMLEFIKSYREVYKDDASAYAGYAYDALHMTLAAIRRAGSTDKAKIRDEIEKTSGYVGVGGTFHLSPTDHLGIDAQALRMVEIKNGKFVLSE